MKPFILMERKKGINRGKSTDSKLWCFAGFLIIKSGFGHCTTDINKGHLTMLEQIKNQIELNMNSTDQKLRNSALKAAYIQAIQYCIDEEKLTEALSYYHELPGKPDVKLTIALVQALFDEKRYPDIINLTESTEEAELLDFKGRALLKQGNSEAAINLWKQLFNSQSQNSALALRLAEALAQNGQPAAAFETLLQLAKNSPSVKTYNAVQSRLSDLAAQVAPLSKNASVKVAIIGSSTLDDLQVFMEVNCYVAGLRPAVWLGGYDQYQQEILSGDSELYEFAPDVIIIKLDAEQVFGYLEKKLLNMTVAERKAESAAVVSRLAALLETLTANTTATVLINNFALPEFSPLGIADRRDEFGQAAVYAAINDGLASVIREKFPTVFVVDEARLVARVGAENARDDRMWYIGRIGISEELLPKLSMEYLRYIKALKGQTKKCVVLDLDNTLWGGIVGEDGPEGLQLGTSGIGNAFNSFQEALLQLSQRGILLAIASKNNPADALEVLEKHPEMVLRPVNFAAMRINWTDKPTNLREIARELNIGVDSLVFLDDNPVERSLMRQMLPEVLTVEMPSDPAQYRRTLLNLPDFEMLRITEEDLARARMYQEQQAREQFQQKYEGDSGGVEKFLYDLQMRVQVARGDNITLPRIAQLINKTNQFNLTTRRYTEAEVREMAGSSDKYRIYGIKVVDRFGDNGLTGVVIAETQAENWRVDTLLLSCRVMGRTVETALINYLIEQAQAAGATRLEGQYIPTAKNSVVSKFYPEHGFTLETEQDGTTAWSLDLKDYAPKIPAWIKLEV